MITRFVLKDAHVPAEVVETMERRIHQRMDAYFKDEAEGDTVIGVRITEQKNTYKVEMTMPYMGHTLRTENQEREISLPALDKGIDVLERQMKKLRTRLARDLLPVYDNLNRAIQAIPEESRAASAALIEGVELTLRELTNVMTKHGITMISPAVGDPFDPQLHQAMFEAPLPGTKAGQIIQVATEGFLLHDRLLRPAQVGVSSNTAG